MKLGFDVDGVLANFNFAYRRLCIEVSNRDVFPPEDDPTYPAVWQYPEHYGYTDDEMARVWERIKADLSFWYGLIPLPGIQHLAGLYWQQHDLYFITQRVGETAKCQTEGWLIDYGVPVPTVLVARRKGSIVRDLCLNAYIDDRMTNVNDVARVAGTGTQVFLLDAPYNRAGVRGDVIRVASVREMLERLGLG